MKILCLFCYGSIVAIVVAVLSGCCSSRSDCWVCLENRESGFAALYCQPLDTSVTPGKEAEFEAKAKGENLEYQWYLRRWNAEGSANVDTQLTDEPGVRGANARRLELSKDMTKTVGLVWCEITARDPALAPARIRTRDANLGTTAKVQRQPHILTASSTGTNLTTTWTSQNQLQPPASTSGGTCPGTFCNYVNFNGSYYHLTTSGNSTAKLSLNSVVQDTSTYDLYVHSGNSLKFCATNLSSTLKQFPRSASGYYTFTVYFKPPTTPGTPCPGNGTALLEVQPYQ